MREPFTYSIYCIPTDQHYYGVRYAKGCAAEQLWKTYFTSSRRVKNLIKMHGVDAFIPKVRRIFETSEKALLWENKFLVRVDAARSDRFINDHNGGDGFYPDISENGRLKNSIRTKAYFSNPESRKKASVARNKFIKENPESRLRSSENAKNRFESKAERLKISDGRKRFYRENPSALEEMSARGKAQFSTEEARKKMSEIQKQYCLDHPEVSERKSAWNREYFSDPANRERHSLSAKKRMESRNARVRISLARLTYWAKRKGIPFSPIELKKAVKTNIST